MVWFNHTFGDTVQELSKTSEMIFQVVPQLFTMGKIHFKCSKVLNIYIALLQSATKSQRKSNNFV